MIECAKIRTIFLNANATVEKKRDAFSPPRQLQAAGRGGGTFVLLLIRACRLITRCRREAAEKRSVASVLRQGGFSFRGSLPRAPSSFSSFRGCLPRTPTSLSSLFGAVCPKPRHSFLVLTQEKDAKESQGSREEPTRYVLAR